MTCPAVLPVEWPGLLTKGRAELRCTKGVGHKGRCAAPPPNAIPIDYPKAAAPIITWVGKPAKDAPVKPQVGPVPGSPQCRCGRQWAHKPMGICIA